MTKKKVFIMLALTIALCIMTLGYAALQEKIDITGGASVDSVYRVEITKIEQTSITGSAAVKDVPSYTGLTANFNVGLKTSSDTITYNIEISNLGTVDVRLNNASINIEGSNKIKGTKSGIRNGDILLAGESKVMTIKITYDGDEETSEITGNININLDYTRLKGGVGEVVEETILTYSVGDVVTFAGSNWYVIEESAEESDYVTLMKESNLTNAELGDYAYNDTFDSMAYYYSDTCHYSGSYGYTNDDTSGCGGHNDYEGSKIKEMLDNQYLPILGEENLKEVEGYKIRLITTEELKNNLGWNNLSDSASTSAKDSGNAVPSWIYSSMYWTMTPYSINASGLWYVDNGGSLYIEYNVSNYRGVRPIINLLKSSI